MSDMPPNRERGACRITRREVIAGAACGSLGGVSGWLLRGQSWSRPETATAPEGTEQALARLREGNQRFVDGQVLHDHETRTWRYDLLTDQHPFAIILGCSDSRVPVELIFDQGFGDLFVIRVAGNVISRDVIGSIAYAISHLHARLLVVLGHERCGAVMAALEAPATRPEAPSIEELARLIGPGLQTLDARLEGDARLSAAIEANIRWSMQQLGAIPNGRKLLDSGHLKMVGAVYDLVTGGVRFLES
jgi:carbonic anhydrase